MVEIISAHPVLVHTAGTRFSSTATEGNVRLISALSYTMASIFDLVKISSPLKSCVYSRFMYKTDLDAVENTQWVY
jgi:hypothetical protein